MLAKRLLNRDTNSFLLNAIRTKSANALVEGEDLKGKSRMGKLSAYAPKRVDIEKGKLVAWCSCGFSEKEPFCDGTHKKLNANLKEDETKFEPLRFKCEESRSVWLCMCRQSSNRPFCDGTHKKLKSTNKTNPKLMIDMSS